MPTALHPLGPAVRAPEHPGAVLQRLYAEQLALDPTDGYIQAHARPGVVRGQVAAFEWYRRWLPGSGAVLDWGCNHAPDSCLLRAACGDRYELHACDFRPPGHFPAFHAFAAPTYAQLGHLCQLPYPDWRFDAVVASGVLEHVAWEHESLKEVHRVLRPGGVLAVTYLPNWLSAHEWYLRAVCGAGFHHRRYGLGEARRTLLRTGFEVAQARYQVTLRGGPLGALARLVPGAALFSSVLCLIAYKRTAM